MNVCKKAVIFILKIFHFKNHNEKKLIFNAQTKHIYLSIRHKIEHRKNHIPFLYICLSRTKRDMTKLIEDSEGACAKTIGSIPN